MKTLILVKRLRLRHVLVRLLYLLSTLSLHKQFQTAIIPPSVATNLLHFPLLLPAVVANHWEECQRPITQLEFTMSSGTLYHCTLNLACWGPVACLVNYRRSMLTEKRGQETEMVVMAR